jgi:hypothetical protein
MIWVAEGRRQTPVVRHVFPEKGFEKRAVENLRIGELAASWRRLYISCLVLSGLFIILAIAAPIFNAVLRAPEPTPSTVVVRKDLCS